jgi:hypothetical protein
MPIPDNELAQVQYTVNVDFSQSSQRVIQPLCGVNKGVLDFGRYGMDYSSDHAGHQGYVHDFSFLYSKVGIQSVRTHDDVFDVANIFRGTGEDIPGPEVVSEVTFGDELQALRYSADEHIRQLYTRLQRVARDYLYADRLVFDFGTFVELLPDWHPTLLEALRNNLPDGYIPPLGTLPKRDTWLFWRPLDATAVLDPDCYRYELSHAQQAWEALVRAHHKYGIGIYFRVGESWRGPSYPEAPGRALAQLGGGQGRSYYAQVGASIVEELASMEVPATRAEANLYPDAVARRGRDYYYPAVSPQFIEVWNEPNGEFYMGPVAEENAPLAHDFTTLARRILFFLNDRPTLAAIPTGGFGITEAGLIQAFSGEDDSLPDPYYKAWYMMEDAGDFQDEIDFLSFHLYVNRDRTGLSVSPAGRVGQFGADLSTIRQQFDALLYNLWHLDYSHAHAKPLHLSEWNYLLQQTVIDDEDTSMTHEFGGAFVSAGLSFMQHEYLGIQSAHFYPAWERESGLFHAYGEQDGDELVHHFRIRRSALAMELHSRLTGMDWVPLSLDRVNLQWPEHSFAGLDILEAAAIGDADDWQMPSSDVVALAAKQEGDGLNQYDVLLTNVASVERQVQVKLHGVPVLFGAPVIASVTRLLGMDPGGADCQVRTPADGISVVAPEETDVDAAVEACYDVFLQEIEFDEGEGCYVGQFDLEPYDVLLVRIATPAA